MSRLYKLKTGCKPSNVSTEDDVIDQRQMKNIILTMHGCFSTVSGKCSDIYQCNIAKNKCITKQMYNKICIYLVIKVQFTENDPAQVCSHTHTHLHA